MSTLAAARADNFYYPPEWDPKKGGLNKQQGQHPLRDRARKLDQGILIIRFEMPFNVWCEGCNHLIGKGVRFNAEKKQIGNYFSTKIWSFVMRSPCCQTRIEVQTDPKNAEYVVVSGGRQKVEAFSAQDAETLELPDQEDKAKYDDPLYKLERGQEDKRKAIDNASRLEALYADSLVKSKNDYAMNKALRKTMREARKAEKARDARREALGLPETVRLLPETAADIERAALVAFGDPNAHDKARRLHRQAIKSQSIFASPASQLTPTLPASAVPERDARSLPHLGGSAPQRPLDARGGAHAAASLSAVSNRGQQLMSGAVSASAVNDRGQGGVSDAGPREEGRAPVGCFGGGMNLLKATKAAGRTGLAALGIKSGMVKKRTIAEKAALELKRRRMASGLTLGFTAPETVARPGPTYVMKR